MFLILSWFISFILLFNLLVLSVLMNPKRIKDKKERDFFELTERKNIVLAQINQTKLKAKHFPEDENLSAELESLNKNLKTIEFELNLNASF